MSKTKITNRMKATIWTETMKVEIDGSIAGVIIDSFMVLNNAALRERVIAKIQEQHLEMTNREQVAKAIASA